MQQGHGADAGCFDETVTAVEARRKLTVQVLAELRERLRLARRGVIQLKGSRDVAF
jgi:hypothetical protein